MSNASGPVDRATFHSMAEGTPTDWQRIMTAQEPFRQELADRVLDHLRLLGGDRNLRDRYRDHQWFDACAEFCELYDQAAFEPDYETLPLDHFEPMVRRVFAQPRADWQGL